MNKHSFSLKKEELEKMFDQIANKYDFINHFLSLGMDNFWRYKSIQLLKKIEKHSYNQILDLATGTGDFAILLAKTFRNATIIGMDPSKNMLILAKKKIKKKFLDKKIQLIQGDSHSIPFNNETFDVVTISFGIRNFYDIHVSIQEIFRILKPHGILEILEFSYPSNFFIKKIYQWYSFLITNKLGGLLSGNYNAYCYLKESIQSFCYCGKNMTNWLKFHRFNPICIEELTFQIVSIYLSEKN
ncbi:bifunctional demethylmenaquinone methyltransferase/2-methoxy-6-polyprenyl-1,4-benzoquinol methylase UbiE [Blattabacterium cuenoti]|uniref:bifunctional demethylmenaquinone methyltransferase/2-methoxy-6-polyprenyl-1,4-benzoquinol methylase UbiE n=1 Tax=Blattabacterium cuenoti TaxID=1653831 RepID=UPI00163C3AAC|nr:bifunctional demethylmenaquinone methyltransferase/2-methoxy-6-polyprenyl-1,4-benzoquinol methylase UbiE [Blattabacterium cuenoti]